MPFPASKSLAAAYAQKRQAMHRRKMWRGSAPGVAPDRQADDLHVDKVYNTSGEPHTRGLDEEEHPMEFMAHGGEVYDYEDEDDMPDDSAPVSGGYAMGGEIEPAMGFHGALRRRPRKFTSSY